ncbi:hypothetical protein QQX10_04635 [Demequina sp. SYSU T00039]|uniref:Uncharacterized protein n=1 Tax=Demequina lignilytica TaxID=3051663 RepID=A0AAW7M1T8_9MICO|nr:MULTISPECIES: hypothetical protein [unclassified Demequina]MDN4477281.1 hypothetical protein [Demequina sp. SYSU T00039-1]MDN4487454.1 hypothetical protein [Demequina sp. SYSU T00039]
MSHPEVPEAPHTGAPPTGAPHEGAPHEGAPPTGAPRPATAPAPRLAGSHARRQLSLAYSINMAYFLWFWVALALGYWVFSWFGRVPGEDTLREAGPLGWVAILAGGMVLGAPSWIGMRYARRARRAGVGVRATRALAFNIALAGAAILIIGLGS